MLRPGSDASVSAAPIHPVGTAGEIVENEELPDGRFNILLEARFRFRVLDEDPPAPYRVARVEEIPTASFPEPDDEERSVASAVDLFGDVAARARASSASPRDDHGRAARLRDRAPAALRASRAPEPPRDRFAAVALRAAAPAHARVEEPAAIPRALPGEGPRPAEELTAEREAPRPVIPRAAGPGIPFARPARLQAIPRTLGMTKEPWTPVIPRSGPGALSSCSETPKGSLALRASG